MEKKENCYTDTDSYIVYIKVDDICEDIAEDVELRFDTSRYVLERSLPKEKTKKNIWINELRGKIMKKFIGLRAKTNSYFIYDVSDDKKQKARRSAS